MAATEQPAPDTEDAHVQSNGVSEWKAPSLYRLVKRFLD
jgi:hypothetical protein